ncbi:hypothetical protein ACOSQ4_012576 [Xanthoceras sorbifolium]
MIGFKLAAALFLNTSTGPALTGSGYILYKEVNDYIERYEAKVMYNATYVKNYCTINGTMWIGFDDVELVQTKVSYAKEKGLLGYIAWQVPYDDNSNRLSIAIINLITIAAAVIILVLCFVICCGWMRNLKSKCRTKDKTAKQLKDKVKNLAGSVPNVMVYSLVDIEAATNSFSIDNYLGQGGSEPVYKAYKLWKDGKGMEFMDSSLDDTYSSCKLMRCLRVALLCVQEVPNDRPTMLEVFSMLIKNEAKDIMIPKEPAFYT